MDVTCNAAEYRERAAIQQYATDQDASTGELSYDDTAWATEAEIWCKYEQLSGRDYIIAQQSGYVASHRVEMRFRPGIRIKLTRFQIKGIKLYVVHANNVGNRNVKLEILCRSEEVVI